jgi:excisionase family DNA binding protein
MMMVSVHKAAQALKVANESIRVAIKNGRLPAIMVKNHYEMSLEDVFNYARSRWSRARHFSDGEMSITEAAKHLNCSYTYLYYLVKAGMIPHKRKGSLYIVKKCDLPALKKNKKKIIK